MDFDINTLRGISTLLVMAAFFAVSAWAYSRKRKPDFDQAADLPFADEEWHRHSQQAESSPKNPS